MLELPEGCQRGTHGVLTYICISKSQTQTDTHMARHPPSRHAVLMERMVTTLSPLRLSSSTGRMVSLEGSTAYYFAATAEDKLSSSRQARGTQMLRAASASRRTTAPSATARPTVAAPASSCLPRRSR